MATPNKAAVLAPEIRAQIIALLRALPPEVYPVAQRGPYEGWTDAQIIEEGYHRGTPGIETSHARRGGCAIKWREVLRQDLRNVMQTLVNRLMGKTLPSDDEVFEMLYQKASIERDLYRYNVGVIGDHALLREDMQFAAVCDREATARVRARFGSTAAARMRKRVEKRLVGTKTPVTKELVQA
jgi:hypothetical protein